MLTRNVVNGFCIIILFVLLLAIMLQSKKRERSTNNFLKLVIASIIFFTVSLLSDLCEGKPDFSVISYILNTLCYVLIDGVIISFIVYLDSLFKNEKKEHTKSLLIATITCIARSIVSLILTFSGKLFAIENGLFVEKELAIVPYILIGLIVLFIISIVIYNKKYFSNRQFIVILIYLLLPIIPVIIEAFTGIYYLSSAAITLSILLMYVLLQAVTIEQGKIRESLLEELSNTDILTTINNRRSYYTKLDSLDNEKNIGVIFCDINGFKYANDNFGHAYGDELIKNFSNILLSMFDKSNIFRISGDEFIILLYDISKEDFDNTFNNFKKTITINNSIAAVGSSFGLGKDIEKLVSNAEILMYVDKSKCVNSRYASTQIK